MTSTRTRLGVLGLAALLAIPIARAPERLSGLTFDREVVDELAPALGPSRTFVVVGTDSRRRIPNEDADRFGSAEAVSTEWADVVMLVTLRPDERRLKVLSLPRQLLVDVDGEQKLGATLESGGPRAVVRAVRQVTGARPNHYLQLDFVAFSRLVDRLGGVTVTAPAPARDLMTGLTLSGGAQRLDGAAALAFARSRSYEEWLDGRWTPADDGDLGRIGRQHRLLQAIVAERPLALSVGRLWEAREVARHVKVDARLSLRALLRFAGDFTSGSLAATDVETIPTAPVLSDADQVSPFPPAHVGAVSYLLPAQPDASRAIAAFIGDDDE